MLFEVVGDATVTADTGSADYRAQVMLAVVKSLAGSSSTITANAELVGTESTNVTTVTSQGEIEDDGAPSTKKICNPKEQQAQVQCSIWGYFDEMLSTEDSSTGSAAISNDADSTAELSRYLSEPLLCHKDDPAAWWQMNRLRFPLLAKLARSSLGEPPTSVPSERLLSIAGDVISGIIDPAFCQKMRRS